MADLFYTSVGICLWPVFSLLLIRAVAGDDPEGYICGIFLGGLCAIVWPITALFILNTIIMRGLLQWLKRK